MTEKARGDFEAVSKKAATLAKKVARQSIIERMLEKNSGLTGKEIAKLKTEAVKLGVFVGLFAALFAGVASRNSLLALFAGVIVGTGVFAIRVAAPIIAQRKHSKKIEASLPIFLLRMETELRTGKTLFKSIEGACKEESPAADEFGKVIAKMRKGTSFSAALAQLAEKNKGTSLKRIASSLGILASHGTRDTSSVKKLAQEMLFKQRIESKEFSGKMVVFALVFIAVSAIVPAMFQSFMLIGSYFMKPAFSAQQAFFITVALFPLLDLAVLAIINSKTPLFLKE